MSERTNPSQPLSLVGETAESGDPALVVTGLCDADGRAFDAVIAARCADSDFVAATADDRDRVARCQQLMAILDRCPVEEPPDDLTQRTLAHIRNERQRQRDRKSVV